MVVKTHNNGRHPLTVGHRYYSSSGVISITSRISVHWRRLRKSPPPPPPGPPKPEENPGVLYQRHGWLVQSASALGKIPAHFNDDMANIRESDSFKLR